MRELREIITAKLVSINHLNLLIMAQNQNSGKKDEKQDQKKQAPGKSGSQQGGKSDQKKTQK